MTISKCVTRTLTTHDLRRHRIVQQTRSIPYRSHENPSTRTTGSISASTTNMYGSPRPCHSVFRFKCTEIWRRLRNPPDTSQKHKLTTQIGKPPTKLTNSRCKNSISKLLTTHRTTCILDSQNPNTTLTVNRWKPDSPKRDEEKNVPTPVLVQHLKLPHSTFISQED